MLLTSQLELRQSFLTPGGRLVNPFDDLVTVDRASQQLKLLRHPGELLSTKQANRDGLGQDCLDGHVISLGEYGGR